MVELNRSKIRQEKMNALIHDKVKMNVADKRISELHGYAELHGYKPGWAYYMSKKKGIKS